MSHASKFLADSGHHATLKMREEQAAQRDLENRVRAAHDPVFAAELAKLEAADPRIARRRAMQERQAARNERKADDRRARAERRDERTAQLQATAARNNSVPLSPAMRTTLIVLAVISALTVVGLPITALIAYLLHARNKTVADARHAADERDRAEAARHLTDTDREWLNRHNGQG